MGEMVDRPVACVVCRGWIVCLKHDIQSCTVCPAQVLIMFASQLDLRGCVGGELEHSLSIHF